MCKDGINIVSVSDDDTEIDVLNIGVDVESHRSLVFDDDDDATTLFQSEIDLTNNDNETVIGGRKESDVNAANISVIVLDDSMDEEIVREAEEEEHQQQQQQKQTTSDVDVVQVDDVITETVENVTSVTKNKSDTPEVNESDSNSKSDKTPEAVFKYVNPFFCQRQKQNDDQCSTSVKDCEVAKKRRRLYNSDDAVPEVNEEKTLNVKETEVIDTVDKTAVESNILKHNRDMDGFLCALCGQMYTNKQELIEHQKIVHSACFQE